MLLYGASLIYGFTGTVSFTGIAQAAEEIGFLEVQTKAFIESAELERFEQDVGLQAARYLDEQGVKEHTERNFREDNPPEYIEANELLLKAFGLVEADVDDITISVGYAWAAGSATLLRDGAPPSTPVTAP